MAYDLTAAIAQFSDAVAGHVAAAAPLLAAIRIGANRHVSGIIWQRDLVITSDQALPPLDTYTVVLPGATLTAARPARRDPNSNLVALRLEGAAGGGQISAAAEPRVGGLALALGADADASPTIRLAVIHKLAPTQPGSLQRAPVLDIHAGDLAEGGPVLDATGRLLGMAAISANGQPGVVPYSAVSHMLDPLRPQTNGRRGWLGAALQPITVPDTLRGVVGQPSGRMVVSVSPRGPAELAGLRPGDILLTLDGHSISGGHALRTLLGPERIGRQVEIRLVRNGQVEKLPLIVASQPND